MAENNKTPQASDAPEVEKLPFHKRLVTNHPRTARVVTALVGVAAVATVAGAVKNAKDAKLLDAAAQDLGQALDALEPVATTTD